MLYEVITFLVASTLLGCMAQRLVKRICPSCAEEFEVEAESLAKMGLPVAEQGKITLRRGKGCRDCRNTGYKGRSGIFEVLPISPQIQKMITA